MPVWEISVNIQNLTYGLRVLDNSTLPTTLFIDFSSGGFTVLGVWLAHADLLLSPTTCLYFVQAGQWKDDLNISVVYSFICYFSY